MRERNSFREIGTPKSRVGEDVAVLVLSVMKEYWPEGLPEEGPSDQEIERFAKRIEPLKMLHGCGDARSWFDDVVQDVRARQPARQRQASGGVLSRLARWLFS